MISVKRAHQQAVDLIDSGDPGRPVMLMMTPFSLAVLQVHLASYIDVMGGAGAHQQTLQDLNDIGDRLQKVVVQILEQQPQ